MVNCPYLRHETSHCSGCTGWHCYAFGRKKKLSDQAMCIDDAEWPECPRYRKKVESTKKAPDPIPTVQFRGIGVVSPPGVKRVTHRRPAPPPPPPDDCPYLGPVPAGETACCGLWCYATNGPVRTGTTCQSPASWRECREMFAASRRRVKPYAGS